MSEEVLKNPYSIINPDQVRIIDEKMCEQHKWTMNQMLNVVHKEIQGAKYNNGYCIYAMSVEWKHPIWLASNEYSLT
jgi:hypothetical protein